MDNEDLNFYFKYLNKINYTIIELCDRKTFILCKTQNPKNWIIVKNAIYICIHII
jgi:hypothetical protein